MVKKGDTIYDVEKYVEFRIKHLQLEKKKQPETVVDKKKIQKAIDKLGAKIEELNRLKRVLKEDIKEHSKVEWRAWKHLDEENKMTNKKEFCKCGDSLFSKDGKDRRGLVDKSLCWVCDMDENPDAYK